MQQIPLYAMALMIPPGFDNIAHYGGRGASRMLAVYTENGITYVPKLANEPIDEAVEVVRASVLTHDPIIAQAIIDADAPYVFHEADELYKKRYSAIYPGTGNDLAKAKLITGEIADHCPLLLANPQLVTRELSEVLAGMPDAIKRKAFLEALDGFGDIEKLTTFVDDLANAPELVVAFKERPELVGAWEEMFAFPSVRRNADYLKGYSDFLASSSSLTPPVTKAEISEVFEELGTELNQASYAEHLIEFNRGNRAWGHVDFSDGVFNGNSLATFFDVRVNNQTSRTRVGVALSQNNILELHLNVPQNLQQQWLGTYLVKRSLLDYNPSKVKGWWKESDIYTGGESINLTIYRQKVAEGFSPQDAAFETPTGKILRQNGFGGVPTIIVDTTNEVIIHFNPE